jgi:hypothetical protein
VRILDFDHSEAINFEAEIQFPEAPGIVQVEYFGMHMEVSGAMLIGMKVEAVEKARPERMSLDLLSRVVVDIMNDSSRIIDDLLSEYQRVQMNMVYRGESRTREKYALYLADSIDPLTKAEAYMNDNQYGAELRQILGDITSVHCLSSEDVVILGSKACIAAGPRCRGNEELLSRFIVLCARDNFVKIIFIRLKVLNASLLHIRDLLLRHQEHPNRGTVIRDLLSDTSRDISLLSELQEYLVESLHGFRVPPLPSELSGRKMYSFLDLHTRLKDAMLRAKDLRKLIHGAGNEYAVLVKMMDVVSKSRLEQVIKYTRQNSRDMVLNSITEQRNSEGMEIVNQLMATGFIFAMVDKGVGGVQQWNQDYPHLWLIYFDEWFPGLIFGLHLVLFFVWAVFLTKVNQYLAGQANGYQTWRLQMNRKIDPKALMAWVSTRNVATIGVDSDYTANPPRILRKTLWEEDEHPRWKGPPPGFEVYYDATNGFLLQVIFGYHASKSELTRSELLQLFQDDLVSNRILAKGARISLPEFQDNTVEEID